MISGETFIRRMPHPVHFAGFESDTYRLQQAGWEISLIRHAGFDTIQLALRFPPGGIHAVTAPARFHFMEGMGGHSVEPRASFHVHHMSTQDINIHMQGEAKLSFQPVDCTPHMEPIQHLRLSEEAVFKAIPVGEESEIYVPEQSVPELLDLIRKKQDPKQREIREKRRRKERKEFGKDERGEIKCQILSLAGTA